MAQLAIQLAFAGLGNALGLGIPAIGLSGAGVGSIVGSFVSSLLFPPPDVESFGPRLSDLSITASTYGKAIPICYGTVPVAGDIIDSSKIYETSHKETEEAGKGGGQEVSYTTYTYSVDLAVALCEGPIVGVLQIFANEKLIYDARPGSSFLKPSWLDLKVYQGTETQEPDPTLEALHGAGNVPGYRGLAYVVFPRFQLASFGNRPPTFRFIVVKNGDRTINENVIDISDNGGTSKGPTYSSKTGLLYAAVDLSTTGSIHQLKALDPLSKNIVWTTNLVDPSGDAMDELTRPEVVGDYVAVIGENPVGTLQDVRIGFVDAQSGYVYSVQELEQSAGTAYRGLFPLHDENLRFIRPTNGVTGPDFMSLYTFGGVGFSQTRQKILDPSGWLIDPDSDVGVKKGDVPIICFEIASTTTSDIGVAIWSGSDIPLSGEFQPTYTIVNLGSTATGLLDIHYNEETDSFWIPMDYADARVEIVEVDLDGNATVHNWNTLYSISDPFDTDPLNGPEFENGYLWVRTDQNLYRWNIETLDTPVVYDDTTAIRDFHYEPVTQSMWGAVSDDIVEFQFDKLQDQQVQLSSIVDDLSDRVDIDAGDIDSSELDAIQVRGYVIGNIMSARAALEPLRRAFLFDHSDSGGSIDFRLFGQSLDRTLDIDDIGAHANGDSAPPVIEISRAQESSLPKEVSITYMDVNANYEVGHQRARFIATKSHQSIGIELPIVLNHSEAAQKADVLLHLSHIEREGYVVHAMPVHADLRPADVINVDDGDDVYRMKISEIVNERGVLKLTGVRDEPNVLVSSATGAAITGREATIFIAGVMQFELLNLPALRDDDMSAGFYLAGYSYSDDWPGGVLFKTDDGSVFSEVKTADTAATVGRVWNTPETVEPYLMDNISSLDISLYSGELSSVAYAQLLAGDINAVAYGADDRWEIIQFQTATLETTGRYTVTGLLRGRLGTEHAMDQHQYGDLFVLLDTQTLERISTNQADIGTEFTYRGVTISRSVYDETNIDKAHTHRGTGLIPLSPVHLTSETEPDLDVVLSWRQRTRQIWGDFWSGIESDDDLYDVEIYDGSTLLRTYSSVAAEIKIYSRADQETDLGADTTDTVTVKVYHVSSVVGRGEPAELSLELGPPPNSLKTYALSLSPYFYWLMDITTGTEVASIGTSSGARATMDLYGGEAIKQTSLMTNLHGFSIRFNGGDWGYPLDSYPTQAGANANKTTAFIIKLGGNPTGDCYIHYLKGTGGAASWSAMRIMLTSARKIKFQMRNAANTAWNELLSTTVLTVGDIYFVTASIGADGQKLYINGSLEDSDSGITTHQTTTGWIYPHYGDDKDFGTVDIPDIYFDQLLFWYNKQLTDTEVNDLYIRI